jgi:glycosyltransferase involved in cell wall biosynthesis
MKVLYVIDTLEVGGTERSLCEILSNLSRVNPVVCHIYPGSALKPDYQAAGIRVISLDVPGRYSFARGAQRLEEVVRQERPDLIHACLFRAEMIARLVARRTAMPLVATFVNDSYAPMRRVRLSMIGKLKLYGVQALDAITARYVARFAANTEAVKRSNAAALRIPLDRIEVIHRGRDLRAFGDFDVATRREIRTALQADDSVPVLLNVARLLERKGLKELLEALVSVHAAVGEVRLWVAGEGPYRAEVERRIAELGLQREVRLLGTRRDIPKLLAASDLFVFPSHFEGQPGAIIEAMLAGKPIVATDLPEHRETLTHGHTALLVPKRDPSALADAILRLLRDPATAARLGAAAQQAATERFDIHKIAQQHEDLYDRVLMEHREAPRSRATQLVQ